MPRLFDISALGDKRLQRNMDKLDRGLQTRFINKALRASTNTFLPDAKSFSSERKGPNKSGQKINVRKVRGLRRGKSAFRFPVTIEDAL